MPPQKAFSELPNCSCRLALYHLQAFSIHIFLNVCTCTADSCGSSRFLLCFQLGVLSHKEKGLLQTRFLLLAVCPSSLAMLPHTCIQTLIPYLWVALNTLGSAKSSRLARSGSEGMHQKNATSKSCFCQQLPSSNGRSKVFCLLTVTDRSLRSLSIETAWWSSTQGDATRITEHLVLFDYGQFNR